jgi:hypothetical protein
MQTAWLKTSQLFALVSSAFCLGLYVLRFMSGRWDGGDLAALIAFSVSLVFFSALLLVGFWKTK